MNRKTRKYLSIILLFVFAIPQLASDLHYMRYHDFDQKRTDDKNYFITYKYHHLCDSQILKLHSFVTFYFPFTALLPYSQFRDIVFNYLKKILIRDLFTPYNKRGPPYHQYLKIFKK